MSYVADTRNGGNTRYPVTVDSIKENAIVTVADQDAYNDLTTGGLGNGYLEEDSGGDYLVQLPGSGTGTPLSVTLLIIM